MPSAICHSTSARSACSSTAPLASKGVTSAVPQPNMRAVVVVRGEVMQVGVGSAGGTSAARREREHVPHREHAAPPHQPTCGDERALGEHAAVARLVLQSNL